MSASFARSGAGGARARGVSASLLAVFLLTGCYSVTPVPPTGPAPGARIRAELTREGAERMASEIGSGAIWVDGYAARVGQSEWDISLVTARMAGGAAVQWNREVVRFPVSTLGSVTERRFQKRRSYMTAGIITALALVGGRLFGDDLLPSRDEDAGAPPQ
jgi:hypothetical protein